MTDGLNAVDRMIAAHTDTNPKSLFVMVAMCFDHSKSLPPST